MFDRIEELKNNIELRKIRILEAQSYVITEENDSEKTKKNCASNSTCILKAFHKSLDKVQDTITKADEVKLTYKNKVCREVMAIYDSQNLTDFIRLSQVIFEELEKEIGNKSTNIEKVRILQEWFTEEFKFEESAKKQRLEAIEQAKLRQAQKNNVLKFSLD